jgi:hypothetical protein
MMDLWMPHHVQRAVGSLSGGSLMRSPEKAKLYVHLYYYVGMNNYEVYYFYSVILSFVICLSSFCTRSNWSVCRFVASCSPSVAAKMKIREEAGVAKPEGIDRTDVTSPNWSIMLYCIRHIYYRVR